MVILLIYFSLIFLVLPLVMSFAPPTNFAATIFSASFLSLASTSVVYLPNFASSISNVTLNVDSVEAGARVV